MKNVEKQDSVHLDKLIADLKAGHYVIPDFQREFEWSPSDVNDLIRAIFMDYYIGTLLLWKTSDQNMKVLSCEPIQGFSGNAKPAHIVLDGQQRLTAIYFAFFNPNIDYPNRKNRYYFFLNIKSLLDSEYEEAFYYNWETKYFDDLLKTRSKQFEQHIFPLEIIGSGTWGIIAWIKEYQAYWESKKNEMDSELSSENNSKGNNINEILTYAGRFETIIKELLNEYQLSYIELDKDISVPKVCDIFTKINSKGVELNIFDLLNAILRPHQIYLKELWRNSASELDYTDPSKMKIYVFQVMSILAQTYCSSKYLYYLVPHTIKTIKQEDGTSKDIVLINSEKSFSEKWNEAADALKQTIKALKNPRDYGAINPKYVPYPSIIPVFTAIRKHVDKEKYKNRLDINDKIKKWYWSSIFTLNYSSSVESTSAKDFISLKKWFDDDLNEPETYTKLKNEIDSLDFSKQQRGGAIYNAIFNILILNEARDLQTYELPEYEELDAHHIVPYSWGKVNVGGEINSILNQTPISALTNRVVINDRMPNEYIKEMLDHSTNKEKVYEALETHLISRSAVEILLKNPFTKEDYFKFIAEREKSIRQYLKNNIINSKEELPVDLKQLNDEIEKIELQLRDLIASKINTESYTLFLPLATREKVETRILQAVKKNPSFQLSDFQIIRKKLDYLDLQEYYELIASKNGWEIFEVVFKNKTQVQNKFVQLGDLRNAIRHSRDVTEITTLEGKAAITWFKAIFNNIG